MKSKEIKKKGPKISERNFKWFGYWARKKRNKEKNKAKNKSSHIGPRSQSMHPSGSPQAVPATSLHSQFNSTACLGWGPDPQTST